MAVNRGKKFEQVIRESFERVPGVSIDRLNDNTAGFKGIAGICDFIVYREPYEYYFECKSVHGNRLPFSNITETQWKGLMEKSQIDGVFAGVICWWIDKDRTFFLPIQKLAVWRYFDSALQLKSISVEQAEKDVGCIEIQGKKKRVFFEYDMEEFLDDISEST